MDTVNPDNYNLDASFPSSNSGDPYQNFNPYNQDYNRNEMRTMMGDNPDYSNYGDQDFGMLGLIGAVGFTIIVLLYIAIFFLLPIYMMVVTDATLKRKYWWTFGLMFPGINLVTIPIYWFGEFQNKPHITYTKAETK
jgi:hypothetical protein